MLQEYGEVVNRTVAASWCPWAREEVTVWRVEVGAGEAATSHLVTTRSILDEAKETIELRNAQEPWIVDTVQIRWGQRYLKYNRTTNHTRSYFNCFRQEDARLVSLLRASPYNLRPPSEDTYNFSSPTLSYGQHGQAKFLDMVVFKGRVTDGFFVEAGADDFTTDSNTLFLEVIRGWTGLLVEPNPIRKHPVTS